MCLYSKSVGIDLTTLTVNHIFMNQLLPHKFETLEYRNWQHVYPSLGDNILNHLWIFSVGPEGGQVPHPHHTGSRCPYDGLGHPYLARPAVQEEGGCQDCIPGSDTGRWCLINSVVRNLLHICNMWYMLENKWPKCPMSFHVNVHFIISSIFIENQDKR